MRGSADAPERLDVGRARLHGWATIEIVKALEKERAALEQKVAKFEHDPSLPHTDGECGPLCPYCRIATLEQERKEAVDMCRQAVNTGMAQASEWDRFWRAMGVDSEDITVDEAIAKYAALKQELEDCREGAALWCRDVNRLREAIRGQQYFLGKLEEIVQIAHDALGVYGADDEWVRDTQLAPALTKIEEAGQALLRALTEGENDGREQT